MNVKDDGLQIIDLQLPEISHFVCGCNYVSRTDQYTTSYVIIGRAQNDNHPELQKRKIDFNVCSIASCSIVLPWIFTKFSLKIKNKTAFLVSTIFE